MPDTDRRPLHLAHWEIRQAGDLPIRGDLRYRVESEPRSAVVICHGFKGFRQWGFFPPLARALARRGHAVITFDFTRNGLGDDGVDFSALELFAENTHSRNVAEIHAVLDAVAGGGLLPRRPEAIGLFGHSRGGGEAVLATADDERVDALVTWAAIATVNRWPEETLARWRRGETVPIANSRTRQQMPMAPSYLEDIERHRERLDLAAAAARVRVAWLIVHGERDESVASDEARTLFAAAGPQTKLLLVESGDHTFGARHPYDGSTSALRIAAQATADWFDRQLD
ncbi:hypothetical protein BH20GEM2_BH20GEM2_09680 [soil metagenome]